MAVLLRLLFAHLFVVLPFWAITKTSIFLFYNTGVSAVHVYGVLEVKCTFAHCISHGGEVVQEYLVLPSCFLMGNISADTDSNFHCMLSNYQLCAQLSRCIHTHFLQLMFNRIIYLFARPVGFQ